MAVNENERLKKLDLKMAQLKAQKQAILSREKTKERKARTRRLIQIGALAEKYLNREGSTPEEIELLLQKLVSLDDVKQNL